MNEHTADVAVIGAGAVGAACAYWAARAGLRVLLLDAKMPTAGTSGACSGLIAIGTKKPGIGMALAAETKRLYPEVVADLPFGVDYHPVDLMMLIENEAIRPHLQPYIDNAQAQGFALAERTEAETRRLEPGLGAGILGSVLSPEASVSPFRMALGLAAGAVKHGAKTLWQAPVEAIEVAGGAVTALQTAQGPVRAEQYVLACGVWSPAVGALAGLNLPVVPRRGEVVVTARCPGLIRHYLMSASSMVVKNLPSLAETSNDPLMRRGGGFGAHLNPLGQCLLGTTRSFEGADRRSTAIGVSAILAAALQRLPALARVRVLRCFAGLRPHSPDGNPMIGRSERVQNLLVATGHDGDGISLSVVTGRLIARLLKGEPPGLDLKALNPDRFAT
jgi:glycine/D-amino acid oxidase-like deaminating enzyme